MSINFSNGQQDFAGKVVQVKHFATASKTNVVRTSKLSNEKIFITKKPLKLSLFNKVPFPPEVRGKFQTLI